MSNLINKFESRVLLNRLWLKHSDYKLKAMWQVLTDQSDLFHSSVDIVLWSLFMASTPSWACLIFHIRTLFDRNPTWVVAHRAGEKKLPAFIDWTRHSRISTMTKQQEFGHRDLSVCDCSRVSINLTLALKGGFNFILGSAIEHYDSWVNFLTPHLSSQYKTTYLYYATNLVRTAVVKNYLGRCAHLLLRWSHFESCRSYSFYSQSCLKRTKKALIAQLKNFSKNVFCSSGRMDDPRCRGSSLNPGNDLHIYSTQRTITIGGTITVGLILLFNWFDLTKQVKLLFI